MITMLYEKTLNRKILGAKQESEVSSNGHSNGHFDPPSRQAKGLLNHIHSFFSSILSRIRSLFKRQEEEKTKKQDEAASMGKILNLMRYVASLSCILVTKTRHNVTTRKLTENCAMA